ncbi:MULTISPECIES: ABC transporter substrate-binding protein [Tissierellales]|jgi:NitT/TauT family transport system substrate-binding protein|uniref:ABC transporter substrate-binding protein n=1 Tax=Acidilutibacter cellobiosedens TaxID=2507161 RepID=A0A410QGN1_9FIRM|nr:MULTISPECIES: MqnA/MqnD/SBP family protein [Tissierellales]MBE6081135.1 ABC transporter substrate-binding protein [Tissierellaceae bacterium]QAT63160.1 ABC transporter substrate-binding protein [Acidilutibacter cellobiosedens]SCL86303.1 ABC transporter, substrate-binding protein, aliphatic sulfonates family [Sporanaerobacter sp. PP17-6a]
MKKKFFLLILSLVLILSIVSGCSNKNAGDEVSTAPKEEQEQPKTLKFSFPDGLPALTAAKLDKENPAVDKNVTINYELLKAPDVLVSSILKGEPDIAIVPSNLAAQAFNKGMAYRLAGTSTWGSLYMISTEEINSFEDLKGKEIYSIGKGLTPDIVLRYVLSENGIDPDKDVTITYLNAATELGPAFLSGKTNLAVLPEPLATTILTKKENAKVIFDLNKEWANLTGIDEGYPQSSLIIKEDLIKDDPEFVSKFLEKYKESSDWAMGNLGQLGDYAKELGISVEKNAIVNAKEKLNIRFTETKDCKDAYEKYYEVLMNFEPKTIGGKLPDEGLYFER